MRAALLPGQTLVSGATLALPNAGHASLVGSQLCVTGMSHWNTVCWGQRLEPPRSQDSASFLSHQRDGMLCLYWGTPEINRGSAWCEHLPRCEDGSSLAVSLNQKGRLLGKCGKVHVWIPGQKNRLMPGDVLIAGEVMTLPNASVLGRSAVLQGSQLCATAGHSSVVQRRAAQKCWGARVKPPSGAPSFLSYQRDQHVCLYWGTPQENKGSAWCEKLPGCAGDVTMALILNKAGRLVGRCGEERLWTAGVRQRLMPDEVLMSDHLLSGAGGRAVSLHGSQLCGVGESGERGACWGQRVPPPLSAPVGTTSFLSHQGDHMLCVYWGTPANNLGAAWCEGLPACAGEQRMEIVLTEAGQLVGMCGAREAWPAIWPMPAVIVEEDALAEVEFHGIAHKGLNYPILSTQRALHSRVSDEYRVTSFEWHLDYSGTPSKSRTRNACRRTPRLQIRILAVRISLQACSRTSASSPMCV